MTWNEVLMYIINSLLKIAITILIPYGFSLLKAKLTNDIQTKYVEKAEQLIVEAVQQVQQTYVDNLKAEDLFDANAQRTAFEMVKETVLNTMSTRMKEIVIDAVGDFEEFMRNKIEATVYTMHIENGNVAVASGTGNVAEQ